MSEESTLTEEDLKAVEGVKDRLKFFFSDANVRQDFFIRKQLMNDKGSLAHKLTIESLLRFNTIKQHTTKPAVIVKAAKELSDLLTINDDETAIGRVVPFTKEMMDGHIPKSLHLKNLPLKKKDGSEQEMQYAVTVEEIREIFAKYGEVAMIKLKWGAHGDADGEGDDDDGKKQHRKKKVPTGCALVEFSTEADLEKAAEATLTTKNGESQEPKEKIVLGEAEVQVMRLSEIKSQHDNRKRKSKDDEQDDNVEVKTFTFDWQPGCVITMTGVPVDCDREALLDMIAEGMGIKVEEVKDKKIYVDYSRGEKNAALRFPTHGDHIADLCKKLQDGSLQIKGSKVESARILDGDDEKKYWDDFIAFKNKQIHQRADEKRSRKKQRRH